LHRGLGVEFIAIVAVFALAEHHETIFVRDHGAGTLAALIDHVGHGIRARVVGRVLIDRARAQ
jgi:hypothetical protein